ncbi:hypothetical protein MCAP1_003613 [Malassezia caprae]|uniref:Uncharacterized protein n=1 Tax=Malassezia caprae TaxID=1381934 RepID=A0AAF0IX44_9BASI|nr:hypothetical protein MCAP1_001968 [Malassezia caprae]WFD21351.1 hypothetical protein MCAP1_003613 [Malassezia caprae]
MFKALNIAAIALALAAFVSAKERGMTTDSGSGVPSDFPRHASSYDWAFAPYTTKDCSGSPVDVSSHGSSHFFGYSSCANMSFHQDDNIKAVKLWVNEEEAEKKFRMCNFPHEDAAKSHCHSVTVEPNSWQCVVMITNENGEPVGDKTMHDIHQFASVTDCDKKNKCKN